MLTTSDNIEDERKAKQWDFVADYIVKPLTKDLMEDIGSKYFTPFKVNTEGLSNIA
jgi:hypothetical protein